MGSYKCGKKWKFYFGFRRDTTVVADSFDVGLWISQRDFLAFDYVSHFDDLPRWQTLGDADVAAAMPVIVEYGLMNISAMRAVSKQCPCGKLVSVDERRIDAAGLSAHTHHVS